MHTRSRLQVYTLLQQAYNEQCISDDKDVMAPISLSFEEWCIQQAKASVHFDYWHKTLSLQLLVLRYIRSIREGNFQLYVVGQNNLLSTSHVHYKYS